jgi:ring-1,2-phenylacetyl-CoA epoxidase subunit PaaC
VTPEARALLADALLALADDELVLGHRDSEWTGHAPILEEDIAFANIALDELGHAALWYRLVAELRGEDPERTPDGLIFRRSADGFRCIRMVEQPKGDWAFTIVRQYLFDSAEQIRLPALMSHPQGSIAHTAAKVLNEERYHLRHLEAWVTRLAGGTPESGWRMQTALDLLWPLAGQVFQPMADEPVLVEAGLWPDSHLLRQAWESRVEEFLAQRGLMTHLEAAVNDAGRQEHSSYLEPMVQEMQSVARLVPDGEC